jgi:hypothetical protein
MFCIVWHSWCSSWKPPLVCSAECSASLSGSSLVAKHWNLDPGIKTGSFFLLLGGQKC